MATRKATCCLCLQQGYQGGDFQTGAVPEGAATLNWGSQAERLSSGAQEERVVSTVVVIWGREPRTYSDWPLPDKAFSPGRTKAFQLVF